MDDGFGKIKVIPDHFQVSTPPGEDSLQNRSSPDSQPSTGNSSRYYFLKVKKRIIH